MDSTSKQMIAIVAGTGNISLNIIEELLKTDAIVVAPVGSYDEMLLLQQSTAKIGTGKLVPILTDIPDHDNAISIQEDIEMQYGTIDLMIMVFDNDYSDCSLTDTSYEEWDRMQVDNIRTCFIGGKVILSSMVRRGHGVYIAVSQMYFGDQDQLRPLTDIALCMQTQISKLFAAEVKPTGVKYHHLIINPLSTPFELPDGVGQHIIDLYEGRAE